MSEQYTPNLWRLTAHDGELYLSSGFDVGCTRCAHLTQRNNDLVTENLRLMQTVQVLRDTCDQLRLLADRLREEIQQRDEPIASWNEMLAAAESVVAGLEYRIDEARKNGLRMPVFQGLEALSAAVRKRSNQ